MTATYLIRTIIFTNNACYECGKSLVKRTFAYLEDKQLYVCSSCFENTFCDHCDKCQTAIKPGSKKVEYESRTYHNDCFCCNHCKDPIGRLPFVNKKGVITCLVCYENHVAGKCSTKISYLITIFSVTFRKILIQKNAMQLVSYKQ